MKIKRVDVQVTCVQCGRLQGSREGFWLLCMDCGTFRCPTCFGDPLHASDCPGCQERAERELIMEILAKAKESTVKRVKKPSPKSAPKSAPKTIPLTTGKTNSDRKAA